MKISILLPYKENFSPNYAGAVSLFVKDTSQFSKYKNDIFVFGNMNFKKAFSKNYININLQKKFYKVQAKIMLKALLKRKKKLIQIL